MISGVSYFYYAIECHLEMAIIYFFIFYFVMQSAYGWRGGDVGGGDVGRRGCGGEGCGGEGKWGGGDVWGER